MILAQKPWPLQRERVPKMCGPRGRPLLESFGEFIKNIDFEPHPLPTESESFCEQNWGIWISQNLPN